MQINTIGSPTGLFGAGDAIPAAGGIGFAALLGAPASPTAPLAPGAMPTLAANDTLAPATPLSMAQLLTTAAPLAPAAGAPVAMPAAQPVAETPIAAAPMAQPPADAQPESGVLPAPAAPATAQPEAPAPTGDKPAVPIVDAKPAPGTKPMSAGAVPAPETIVPAEPEGEADVEVDAEQPADAPKTPVKRGSRQTDGAEKTPEIDPAATPDAAPIASDIAAVAIIQTPVRADIAVKPQPSATRQIGEIVTGGRKADAVRADAFDTPGAESATVGDKASSAISAIAGKQGKSDNAAGGDERGQTPAFTLRQDAAPTHATPTHTAGDPIRTQAAPAAAAEPVVAARPGHLGQQMGVEIARKVEAGEDTLRVRLSPDNLGKVEVTLSFDDGGKLHATVRAESAHALDLLRQDMPDLGRSLDQAGIRTDAQSFRFESRSEGGNAQSQQQNGQNSAGNQLAGNDETDTNDTAYRSIRGDGQVDLLA